MKWIVLCLALLAVASARRNHRNPWLVLALLLVWSLRSAAVSASPPVDSSAAPVKPAVATMAGDVPSIEYTHPQQLVDMGNGRRLNLFCSGAGSPTVLFEAGGGEDSMSFRRVQQRLAAVTRVCSYDRAGFGFSDAPRKPSTAAEVVSDLHRLVQRAGIARPLVLMGHSSGGLYAMLYAATYPDDVAGMVLIDPSFIGQDALITARWTLSQRRAWRADDLADIALSRKCLGLAARGLIQEPVTKTALPCLDDPPDADAALHRQLNRELATAGRQAAMLSEERDSYPLRPDGLSSAEAALRRTRFGFQSKPLIVLTAGDMFNDMPEAARQLALAAWTKGHDGIAATSTRGQNLVVLHTSHVIQLDQPGVVVQYATQVMGQVRAAALTGH